MIIQMYQKTMVVNKKVREMPQVNWTIFEGLPGAATNNFEYLCRALIRRHYNQFGIFKSLSNQPGIEFHLNINSDCALGKVGRWYGWQCKWYDLPSGKPIGTTRRRTIEDAIIKTEEILPGMTDWVLWTRHTLTKGDQEWFYGIETKMTLYLWTKDEVEEHLSGPAEILRRTYFGELVLTPDALEEMQKAAVAPVRQRWIPEVHQVMNAENQIRLSLGEVAAWGELLEIPRQLNVTIQSVIDLSSTLPKSVSEEIESARSAVTDYSQLLFDIHAALDAGDYDVTFQLINRGIPFDPDWRNTLRKLRNFRNRAALYFTNVLALIDDAQVTLRTLNEVLQIGVVAVLANAGCGKTQLAAELTSPTEDRTAGIFLHGRDLSARQRLDDLAKTVVIQGQPVPTFEALVSALNAAGERAGRRLPIVIDGLNEAEDPRLWRSYLESFATTVSNYPYALLVCTLRSEFAEEALPESLEQLDIPGFTEHTTEAIAAYFKYYLIEKGDAELPMYLLNHPLTMRLFCEVTNPERKKSVGVEAMPGSLTALFEKYLDQVANRIAQLAPSSCRYYASDIRSALNTTGLTLWTDNARSVELNRLRQILGDSQRSWDQSLVRALECEGVFYRVPGRNPGSTKISINYDALAGHIVADSLLSQHGGAGFEAWLKEASQISLLFGDMSERHPLSGDIFIALAGLVPCRMYRRQFWSLLGGRLKERALYEVAWLSPEYLDQGTVELLAELVKQEPAVYGKDLFNRLITTRAAYSHPLNARFLDSVLRSLTIVDRDIRWTEWIRRSSEDHKTDILQIEKKWKDDSCRNQEDSLRACWIMWILTSTVRTLRDYATRALYYYGMGAPNKLFQQTLESLSINDPYVPERMLAASYGVSMSLWADSEAIDFRSALPNFAESLIEKMLIPDAPNATRHALMKDFALGIIELALRISPSCIISDKMQFLRRPFDQLPEGFPNADQIDESVADIAESAIHMDFGNYTLGRLIPERGNYNYEHPTYKEVRKRIEHRIVELGYSKEIYEKIDIAVRDINWREGPHGDAKIDRYGKKYSWIAYFEMYGLRLDRGQLDDWRNNERTPDVDIDPTFADAPIEWLPDLSNIFEEPLGEVPDWIEKGPTPNYTHLLKPESVDTQEGPWILLEGFIEQHSPVDHRKVFTFLRGILTKRIHTSALLEKFNSIQYPGNDAIAEPFEDHYCFAGEIPWSTQYARALRDPNGAAKADMRTAFAQYAKPGVPVEIPVCRYCWESYHSQLNQAGNVTVLAPYLCEKLGISGKKRLWDFYDEDGKLATMCRVFKEESAIFGSKLFYIRKDLLVRYLTLTGQNLVWMLWGERGFNYRYSRDLLEGHYGLLQNYKHIHRFGLEFDIN
jgi:hypothetical protein